MYQINERKNKSRLITTQPSTKNHLLYERRQIKLRKEEAILEKIKNSLMNVMT